MIKKYEGPPWKFKGSGVKIKKKREKKKEKSRWLQTRCPSITHTSHGWRRLDESDTDSEGSVLATRWHYMGCPKTATNIHALSHAMHVFAFFLIIFII
jgi:hypothetical protein